MEIKVLNKALNILEFICACGEMPTVAKELLQALPDLTQPTCVRLLKTLCEAGYLEQLPHQKSYVPGPLAYYLGGGRAYRPELVATARPVMEEFVRLTGQSVLLTVRHGTFRTIPLGFNAPNGIKLDFSRPRYCDLGLSSTGRLLLSNMPESARREYFARFGYPHGADWGEAPTPEEVTAILNRIQKQRYMVSYHIDRGAGAAAIPVDGRTEAALGCVWSEALQAREHEFMDRLRQAARKISDTLSPSCIIG